LRNEGPCAGKHNEDDNQKTFHYYIRHKFLRKVSVS
jgi:hypothetical protein